MLHSSRYPSTRGSATFKCTEFIFGRGSAPHAVTHAVVLPTHCSRLGPRARRGGRTNICPGRHRPSRRHCFCPIRPVRPCDDILKSKVLDIFSPNLRHYWTEMIGLNVWIRRSKFKMLMRAATVVQVSQDLFYVLLHVLFYL